MRPHSDRYAKPPDFPKADMVGGLGKAHFGAAALRELPGTPSIKEVVRHVGPDIAGELEDLLAGITQLVDRRVARLRIAR